MTNNNYKGPFRRRKFKREEKNYPQIVCECDLSTLTTYLLWMTSRLVDFYRFHHLFYALSSVRWMVCHFLFDGLAIISSVEVVLMNGDPHIHPYLSEKNKSQYCQLSNWISLYKQWSLSTRTHTHTHFINNNNKAQSQTKNENTHRKQWE